MNPPNDERYTRLLHRRLSFPEEIISKTLWISAGVAVMYYNSDDYLAGPVWITCTTIVINIALPFTPHWRNLVIERPKRLMRTDRTLQIAIYCILYLILVLFVLKKAAVLLAYCF